MHRLDHGTRGPMLVAWVAKSMAAFPTQWPSIVKTYHSWVVGSQLPEAGRCGFPIDGKPSRSTFSVLGTRGWAVHGAPRWWNGPSTRDAPTKSDDTPQPWGTLWWATLSTAPSLYTGAGLHLTCTQLDYRHPATGKAMAIQVRPAKNEARDPRRFHRSRRQQIHGAV